MARILYFGVARDLSACDHEDIDLSGVGSVGQLWSLLLERHPSLERVRGATRLAVDMEYATDEAAVAGAHEIAVIPPVAGG